MNLFLRRWVVLTASLAIALLYQNCSALNETAQLLSREQAVAEFSFLGAFDSIQTEKSGKIEFFTAGVWKYHCTLDGEEYPDCHSPFYYTALDDGPHEFSVDLLEPSKDSQPLRAGQTYWTIDSKPPLVTVTKTPASISSNQIASFEFSMSDLGSGIKSASCQLDGQAENCHNSIVKTYFNLPEGTHNFQFVATDNAGHVTSYRYSFLISLMEPEVQLTDPSPVFKHGEEVSFQFSGNGTNGFECQLSSVESGYSSCSSPKVYNLDSGNYTFILRAIGGNESVFHSFVVDKDPPTVTASLTGSTFLEGDAISVQIMAADVGTGLERVECQLNGGNFESCTDSKTYFGLTSGDYSVVVQATDKAGNITATSLSFSIGKDSTPPVIQVTTRPAASSQETLAIFQFTVSSEHAGVASVTCSLDGGIATECISGSVSYLVTPSTHNLLITAIDKSGNIQQENLFWTVLPAPIADTTPPVITVTTQPEATTEEIMAEFIFSATDDIELASVTCQFDGGEAEDCISGSVNQVVGAGIHSLQITAKDKSGNSTDFNYSWKVLENGLYFRYPDNPSIPLAKFTNDVKIKPQRVVFVIPEYTTYQKVIAYCCKSYVTGEAHKFQKQGTYEIEMDLSGLSSGLREFYYDATLLDGSLRQNNFIFFQLE